MRKQIAPLHSKTVKIASPLQRPTPVQSTKPTATAKSAKGNPRIALISPASFGDCINSTLMLKPMRAKYPDAAIDVYTSTLYDSAFKNNPLITQTVPTFASTKRDAIHLLTTIPKDLQNRNYDIIINPHPMVNPGKWASRLHPELGENLICAWINALEEHNIEYTIPLETLLYLDRDEVTKVDNFCGGIPRFDHRRRTIMEIFGESGQSFWKPDWTVKTIHQLCGAGYIVFISCKTHSFKTLSLPAFEQLRSRYRDSVYFINNITIREAAELFNRCDKFISVSSGLSNACNSNWCKKDIDWIEVINSYAVSSAPIRSTGKEYWYDNNLEAFIDFLKQRI